MKTLKYLALFAFSATLLWSCSDDDDGTPPPVNEEEVITTVIVTFIDGADNSVIATYTDLDGDGPGEAVTVVQGTLEAGTAYTGSVRFLNATEDPPEDITLEVEEESDEQQGQDDIAQVSDKLSSVLITHVSHAPSSTGSVRLWANCEPRFTHLPFD